MPWPCLAGDVRIPYGQKSKALMVQSIMDAPKEGQQVAAPSGVRDRPSQSGITPAERVPGGGKPDPAGITAGATPASDAERSALAEIGKRLGRKALAQLACVAKPDTILAWYRRLTARKFDGSPHRTYRGRPRIGPEIEALIVRMAGENSGWGYDRIVGALANLGHTCLTRR